MRTGRVVGHIVAAKRLWDTPSGALLVVELYPPPAQGEDRDKETPRPVPSNAPAQKDDVRRVQSEKRPQKDHAPPVHDEEPAQQGTTGSRRRRLVALDTLGCGLDEHVLVATGPAVTAWFAGKPPPVDALIIASLPDAKGS
jgi:microcompartment protein CcmK/EutM